MAENVKAIELLPCEYRAPCRMKNCKAKATTVARGVDSIGRPTGQYELCGLHAGQVAERERAKGSNCGGCQVATVPAPGAVEIDVVHEVRCLSMALRITSSLRMQAVSATFGGLP